MPRFAANLSMLFTEAPLLERFERAAKAGFSTVELQFPYEVPALSIRDRLQAWGQTMVLHNLPAGQWTAGERGIACLPDRVEEFRTGVGQAIAYATTLGVKQLNCLAGIAAAGVPDAVLRQTFVENLRFAAGALKEAGLRLLIEPVNRHDIPGFWLHHTQQALAVMDEVVSGTNIDNLFLQYDVYHAQRSEGELVGTLRRHLARIGHIQVADNPGRHEPGTGEIRFDFLFEALDKMGYTGFVGCEYKPAAGTEAGLGWLQRARLLLPAAA
jgi:hydroxypyruvate isomerase